MLGQFVKNCSLWEGLMLENFMEDCLLCVGPHSGAGEESEEEGAAGTMYDELTSPCVIWGEKVEKIGNEAEPRKKGGVGRKCFKIWLYFLLHYSGLISNKIN